MTTSELKTKAALAIAEYQEAACKDDRIPEQRLVMMACVMAARIIEDGITLEQWDAMYEILEGDSSIKK